MIEKILVVILFIVYSVFVWASSKNALHMFQQNRYELFRFRKWQKENVTKTYPLYTMVAWFLIALISLVLHDLTARTFAISTILGIYAISYYSKEKYQVVIKPLVYTNRVKRQIVILVIFYLALLIFTINLLYYKYWLSLLILAIFSIYQMHIISIVSIILAPLENMFKNRFMAKAQNKLATNPFIKTIGITGSYGKTSSKNIINDVLSKEYYCLSTPASYNTPLGISITLNRDLQAIHEMFICEMGADKVGDIVELMNFVKPDVGVVTSIGAQHLATFKSQENIIKEKMQMVEMMDENGLVVLNRDEKYIREYNITSKAKQIWYGIENEADIMASDIEYSKDGSKFRVKIINKVYDFETKLLGIHNIYNILAAIAIGVNFNIKITDLQIAIRQLNYVKNRLEIRKQSDYTIIDNAFNSNPVSAKISLDVLARMPNKRICITPGLIDLGEKQYYYNNEFGKYFIDKCDEVILVGRKQTKPIYDGLQVSGFNMRKVHVVNKIYDAYALLSKIKEPECYVLFENDLPDAFNN